MKEKRGTEVCSGEEDEKGNNWRGRKPMTQKLIKEPREASLNMRAPKLTTDSVSLEQTLVAVTTYGLPGGCHL